MGDVLGGTRVVCMRGADCSGCRWRGGAARAAVVGDDAAARAARAPPLHHPARPALARRTQERGMYYTLLCRYSPQLLLPWLVFLQQKIGHDR